MHKCLLLSGISPERCGQQFNDLRRAFLEHQFDVFPLRGESHSERLESYRELNDIFFQAYDWIGLVGVGEGGDDFAKYYYDYLSMRPAGALVLIEPKVTVFRLNEIACPYLVVSVALEPEFVHAVNHHLQRFGDTTKLRAKSSPRQIADWLERSASRAGKLAA